MRVCVCVCVRVCVCACVLGGGTWAPMGSSSVEGFKAGDPDRRTGRRAPSRRATHETPRKAHAPCCLEDGDAEGLREGAVEKDVAPREHVAHVLVRHCAQKLDPVVQLRMARGGEEGGSQCWCTHKYEAADSG